MSEPITFEKCPCGHPSCKQYIMSNQGSVGFQLDCARLFAAAPDLLEALEAYDDFVRNELAGPVPIMDFLKDKPELEAVYLKGCEAAHKATGDAS